MDEKFSWQKIQEWIDSGITEPPDSSVDPLRYEVNYNKHIIGDFEHPNMFDIPIKPATAWHNYRTGTTDWLYDAPGKEQMRNYIPQNIPAQNLYDLYQQLDGLDYMSAAIKVLEKTLGIQ